MSPRRAGGSSRALVATALLAAGCARADDAAAGRGASDEPTVFTDSALFRELCLESDSGLTMSVGRCTPRHQGNPIP